MIRLCTVFVAITIFMTGCSTVPRLTREEFFGLTTRTYSGVTPEVAIAAGQRLFLLADTDDITFTHIANGFVADRSVTMFMLIAHVSGHYRWNFLADPLDQGVRVTVLATPNLSGGSAMVLPVSGGGTVAVPTHYGAGSNPPFQWKELYDLFWARLDYLLGRGVHWPTCKAWEEKYEVSSMGRLEALCFNADDKTP